MVSSQNAVDSGRFELPPLACYVNMMYYPGLKHQTAHDDHARRFPLLNSRKYPLCGVIFAPI